MAQTPRDRLVRLLAGGAAARPSSAMLRLPSDAVEVHVVGVGDIALPVRAAQAKRLMSVARPAEFGHGEETLSDRTVRDTWQLEPAQVSVGGPRWDAHLEAALTRSATSSATLQARGCEPSCTRCSCMAPGSSFLPHQDSEKHDEMVATLVVSLPSVHTGGELVVDDGGAERTYRASRDDLVLVAFYADSRHEVTPVRSGYRVTLTFNLLLTAGPAAVEPGPVAQAATLLTEHFTSPATSRYGGRDLGEPTRLAFLLDHEYSQRGLASQRCPR